MNPDAVSFSPDSTPKDGKQEQDQPVIKTNIPKNKNTNNKTNKKGTVSWNQIEDIYLQLAAAKHQRDDVKIRQYAQELIEIIQDNKVIDSDVKRGWYKWLPARLSGRKLMSRWLISMPFSILRKVINIMNPENWGYNEEEEAKNIGRYLYGYFTKLYEQKEVYVFDRTEGKYNGDELLAWNTGLVTENMVEIYALMAPYKGDPPESQIDRNIMIPVYPPKLNWEYILVTFLTGPQMTKMNMKSRLGVDPFHPEELPKRAFFFDKDPELMVYDPNIPFSSDAAVDWNHLIVRSGIEEKRLPQYILDDNLGREQLVLKFRQGLEKTKLKLLYQPRLAIPQFFRDKNEMEGELQLLLPLSLGYRDCDVAVTLRVIRSIVADSTRATGRKAIKSYTVGTILSIEDAYYNARLIQPVDQNWLRGL